MTPEEFLEKYRNMQAGAPADFAERYRGSTYGSFRQSPNIEDRRNETLMQGGLGALKAEMLKPETWQYPMPPAAGLPNQLGAGDLDRMIAFKDIQASNDPAEAMAYSVIDNPEGEV
jgi:hypothetical protein